MDVPRNLRYSPVNWLIVDWGFNGQAFANCGLPQPEPCRDPKPTAPAPCVALPIQEAIDTYDWERWLPEVIIGIEEPDEEIAASYVREAAIEFCKTGRVLQREVVIPLQTGVSLYPVLPYDQEQVVGVIGATLDERCPCACGHAGSVYGLDFVFDVARNQITVSGPMCKTGRLLRLLVWSAPTEDACEHDKFLYERFRADITKGARRNYANALHFRDRQLMGSLPTAESFTIAMAMAKTKAMTKPSMSRAISGSGMWGHPMRRGL